MNGQKMKILFIYPHIGDGKIRTPKIRRYFPWGFATVMQMLENDGHQIQLLDIYGNDFLPDEVERELDTMSADAVCISGFASYNYSYVLYLAEQVKKRYQVPVIVGGILSDHHYRLLLSKPCVDICVIGEGELTALELFRNLDNKNNVKGIAFKEKSDIIVTPPRELIKNLDDLPMPNFKLWNIEPYLQRNLWADDLSTKYEDYSFDMPSYEDLHPNIALFFGRGCPFKCNFCSRSYQTVRYKSVDRVINEIQYMKENFKVKAIHFNDELVVLNRKLIQEFCQKVKKLDIYWDCQARVNTVDAELLSIMKDANCYSIGFGFESGSNKMLQAMNKGVNRAQNEAVLLAARQTGMHLKIQLMCGYPGETKDTLKETIDMMDKSGLPPRTMNWATPLPGSDMYLEAVNKKMISSEEEYLIKLGQLNMNSETDIVLNVSGLSDDTMKKLLIWANRKMEFNFIRRNLMNHPFSSNAWRILYFFIRKSIGRIAFIRKIYRKLRYGKILGH